MHMHNLDLSVIMIHVNNHQMKTFSKIIRRTYVISNIKKISITVYLQLFVKSIFKVLSYTVKNSTRLFRNVKKTEMPVTFCGTATTTTTATKKLK